MMIDRLLPKLRPEAKVETKWSTDKLVELATQNQRRQYAPKSRPSKTQSGMTKKKNRQSTPKSSFKYKAQQAALLESANLSQVKPGPSPNCSQFSQKDSEISNRSFPIFNVDDPKPSKSKLNISTPNNPEKDNT